MRRYKVRDLIGDVFHLPRAVSLIASKDMSSELIRIEKKPVSKTEMRVGTVLYLARYTFLIGTILTK